MQWAMAELGFQNCPILWAEILGVEYNEMVFSPLHCYTKTGSPILAASNKLHQGMKSGFREQRKQARLAWKSPRAS